MIFIHGGKPFTDYSSSGIRGPVQTVRRLVGDMVDVFCNALFNDYPSSDILTGSSLQSVSYEGPYPIGEDRVHIKYLNEFLGYERVARENNRGLWGIEGSVK